MTTAVRSVENGETLLIDQYKVENVIITLAGLKSLIFIGEIH